MDKKLFCIYCRVLLKSSGFCKYNYQEIIRNLKKQDEPPWYVYILECSDGTYYTGITTDPGRRVSEHNSSDLKGARYTRIRQPVKLVYQEEVSGRSGALKREYQIKKMNRKDKIKLLKDAGV